MGSTVHSDFHRNLLCGATDTALAGGYVNLVSAGAVVLATLPLEADAFGTPVAGVMVAFGGDGTNPISDSNRLVTTGEAAASTGTIAVAALFYTSDDDLVMTSDVTHTSGDGHVKLVNTSIAVDQPVDFTALTYTQPATQ